MFHGCQGAENVLPIGIQSIATVKQVILNHRMPWMNNKAISVEGKFLKDRFGPNCQNSYQLVTSFHFYSFSCKQRQRCSSISSLKRSSSSISCLSHPCRMQRQIDHRRAADVSHSDHQLRLVVHAVIYRFFYIPCGCSGFLNHRQYGFLCFIDSFLVNAVF